MSTKARIVFCPPDSVLIKHGHIIDPSHNIDFVGDILVIDGKVETTGKSVRASSDTLIPVVDASGLIVCPGFIDLHCHLREPGFEDKETIATGARAAAAGGFTTVCCMPNTNPPIDSRSVVNLILEKAAQSGGARVLPIGCVSKGRKGEELAEMAELAEAGVVAFSDDGSPVSRATLMRHALEYSRSFGLPVMNHCEDLELSRGGVMNEGRISILLGLRGSPAAAEESMVARDIALLRLTGGRLHLAHISTRGSVELIRQAKEHGLPVTAEATPHHLTLTEDRVAGHRQNSRTALDSNAYDTNAKVSPPLRTSEDVEALIDGVRTGVIDAIATDHAPHATVDKTGEFDSAALGISGLETALASLLGLVRQDRLDVNTLILRLTSGPARVLGASAAGSAALKPGATADITVFDPDREWTVLPEALLSKGKNTPLTGQKMKGKVMLTLVGGRVVYKDEAVRPESPDPRK
ncbi:MAG: dihydroorotase [Chloroflexi bacterium]|nr:dihydroorotase [Chloroflexota bacterium]